MERGCWGVTGSVEGQGDGIPKGATQGKKIIRVRARPVGDPSDLKLSLEPPSVTTIAPPKATREVGLGPKAWSLKERRRASGGRYILQPLS